jgi:hypothetical protein
MALNGGPKAVATSTIWKQEQSETDNKRSKRHASTLEDCNEDVLLFNLDEVQAINPENVIKLATEEDFNSLCNLGNI